MPSIDEKSLLKLVHEGCDSAMVRFRLDFAEADSVLKYLRPLVGLERAHPTFLPTQKSGRWSVKNPPLANFSAGCINPVCEFRYQSHRVIGPQCWSLRDIVVPEKGFYFIHFDWEAIEARLAAGYSGDDEDVRLFEERADIHSYTLQKMFWGLTEEDRYAYACNVLGVKKGVFGSTVVDQEGQVLFETLRGLKARINLLSQMDGEWGQAISAPGGNEGWPGRNCTPQKWKQARQPIREFGSNDTLGARTVTSYRAWAAWVTCGGPPPDWQGGSDWRRVGAKTCRFSLAYGADHRAIFQAKDIDKLAREAGLDRDGIEDMAKRYLQSKPKLTAWKRRVWADILKTQEVRTPLGRRKRLFVTEEERASYRRNGRATKSLKEGLNHLAQGQCAGMMNRTIIALKRRWPEHRLAYQAHDGWVGVFPVTIDPWPEMREIVERSWDLGNGVSVKSVAEFERIDEDGTHKELR